MKETGTPQWNGEFGPVYASPDDADWEKTNAERYNLLKDQLNIYQEAGSSWSIWLYKCVPPGSRRYLLLARSLAADLTLGHPLPGTSDSRAWFTPRTTRPTRRRLSRSSTRRSAWRSMCVDASAICKVAP
jgi:hypothetical protein